MLKIQETEFYKIIEVAKMLDVHPVTVRTWIKTGRLKAVRIGRPLYVSEKDIKEFLQNSTDN